MLSMENSVKFESIVETVEEEEGEILEDGEIEDAGNVEEQSPEEQIVEGNEESDSDEKDEKKKHKHHKRRRRKHEDRKSEEKKSRHKKRKGEDLNEEGGEESPSSRKKKKRKRRKDRESTSPEVEAEYQSTHKASESPPLPSEQNMYGYYDTYNEAYGVYEPSTEYQSTDYNYAGEAYQEGYSSGSNSYYSDFESHLAQYESYKKQSSEPKNDKSNEKFPSGDEENYYSVGFDETNKPRRRHNDSRPSQRTSRNHSSYEERRSKRSKLRGVQSNSHHSSNNDDRPLCKFFREGHCSKGDKCGFSHQRTHRSRRDYSKSKKVMELCQYYASGVCVHGDNCNYMHEDYPCKYFHTGTKCINGDNCKFSHEPANSKTEDIIKKFHTAYSSVDDSEEIEALEKVGIKPLQKPPPGVGLLPTPPSNMRLPPPGKPVNRKQAIPSLFDITVTPSVELQQKIDNNFNIPMNNFMMFPPFPRLPIAVPSLTMTDDEIAALQASMGFPPKPYLPGKSLLPQPNMGPPHLPTFPPRGLVPQNQLMPQWDTEQMENYNEYYEDDTNLHEQNNNAEVSNSMFTEPPSDPRQNNYLRHVHHDNEEKADEDVIRMDDHDVIKAVRAPDFLPAKQKALFMRINQKRTLSSENKTDEHSNGDASRVNPDDNWTYSSDEEDKKTSFDRAQKSDKSSVQSIMEMISSKKSQSTVDTKLLSKVAGVINMVPSVTHQSKNTDYTSPSTALMSPPRQPHPKRERKASNDTPHLLRRRLSTSELAKEPVTIPLVVKQSADSMHIAHPDPRMTLSRLFGKKRSEFRAPLPGFYSDELMLTGAGKLPGLKITLSSEQSKRSSDPRLIHSKIKTVDPRSKTKINDPRLRARSKPEPQKHSIPSKPSALLTKPPTSVIPSLPELDLDFVADKTPPREKSPKLPSPVAKMPILSRPNVPTNNHMVVSDNTEEVSRVSVEEENSTKDETIAPYDPRFITAGSTNKTNTATTRAPYDPRVLTSQVNIPPLFDPRSKPPELVKHMPLPKLTPAPGYAGKIPENGVKTELPSGEQQDF